MFNFLNWFRGKKVSGGEKNLTNEHQKQNKRIKYGTQKPPAALLRRLAKELANSKIIELRKTGLIIDNTQLDSVTSQIYERLENPDNEFGPIKIYVSPTMDAISHRSTERYTACASSPIRSDSNLKQDVRSINGALDKVLRLRGVTFSWKNEQFPALDLNSIPGLGFLAQDMEKVFPELVSHNGEGFKSVHYSQLTAILVEAVKEQNVHILELKERVKELEAQEVPVL